uniref:Uncharacterized protein n=1 Tax=Magnetospirillum gryphiswaldense TaxID=55518 RepID=A4TZF7_9PROT|nr:hypothetical protein MGR_1480 [Magnetospirillum gryphiswaldense MSR-1]
MFSDFAIVVEPEEERSGWMEIMVGTVVTGGWRGHGLG